MILSVTHRSVDRHRLYENDAFILFYNTSPPPIFKPAPPSGVLYIRNGTAVPFCLLMQIMQSIQNTSFVCLHVATTRRLCLLEVVTVKLRYLATGKCTENEWYCYQGTYNVSPPAYQGRALQHSQLTSPYVNAATSCSSLIGWNNCNLF